MVSTATPVLAAALEAEGTTRDTCLPDLRCLCLQLQHRRLHLQLRPLQRLYRCNRGERW